MSNAAASWAVVDEIISSKLDPGFEGRKPLLLDNLQHLNIVKDCDIEHLHVKENHKIAA